MAVRIGRGAKQQWRSGSLQFCVRTAIGSPTDAAGLREVVTGIGTRLLELGDEQDYGPKFVSDPVPLADGLVFWIDCPDVPRRMNDRIVETVVDGLQDAGLDARLSATEGAFLEAPAVPTVLAAAVPVHPPARDALTVLPRAWVDQAIDWVAGEADGPVMVESGAAFLVLPADAATAVVRQWLAYGRSVTMQTDVGAVRRTCSVGHPTDGDAYAPCPHVSISIGSEQSLDELSTGFEAMVERARQLGAGAAWTFVSLSRDHNPRRPQPFWVYGPGGRDATVVLADRVLDAHPWQRLTPAQAANLPADLGRQASFDAATGELRLAGLVEWLRDGVHTPRFRTELRAGLGAALATKDQVWQAMQDLPPSYPRPAGEAEPEISALDLAAVRVQSWATSHPSLGVEPLELLSLRRGKPYGDRPVSLSTPVSLWLSKLGQAMPTESERRLHRLVLRVADGGDSTGRGHGTRHRLLLADWLIATLTPHLLEVAGLPGARELRRAPSFSAPVAPLELIRLLLERLLAVLPEPAGEEPLPEHTMLPGSPTVRAVQAVAGSAADAASVRRHTLRGPSAGYYSTRQELYNVYRERPPADEATAFRLWRSAALNEFHGAFDEACEFGGLLHPLLASRWDRAFRRSGLGPFRTAAAEALLFHEDPESAWDAAVAGGQQAVPGYWEAVTDQIREQLPSPERDQAWAVARQALTDTFRSAQRAPTLGASTAIAEAICDQAAAVAYRNGQDEQLTQVLWDEVDVLSDRLTEDLA